MGCTVCLCSIKLDTRNLEWLFIPEDLNKRPLPEIFRCHVEEDSSALFNCPKTQSCSPMSLCNSSHLGKTQESPVMYVLWKMLLLLLPNVGQSAAPQKAEAPLQCKAICHYKALNARSMFKTLISAMRSIQLSISTIATPATEGSACT